MLVLRRIPAIDGQVHMSGYVGSVRGTREGVMTWVGTRGLCEG